MALRETIVIPASEDEPRILRNVGGFSEVRITAPYTIENAYIRVTRVDAGRGTATASVEARTADGEQFVCALPGEQFAHDRAVGGAEITTQAYNHLKTLPEYDGAEDV